MALSEFELIERYFKRPSRRHALGVGDDCALFRTQAGYQLGVSSDMLVEGRHFFRDVDPARLGHKALAVNLSDLAACGADPLGFTLALALPEVNEPWLAGFSRGLFDLADNHGCELLGGDTTRGPLNVCITVFGELPAGQALLRSGARQGDDIWVSGTLGDARLALDALRGMVFLPPEVLESARTRLERPSPRVALGQALRGVAHAAIDLSDGLVGDLGHVMTQSGSGADLDAAVLRGLMATPASSLDSIAADADYLLGCVLAGGDDYELAFTAPRHAESSIHRAAAEAGVAVTRIGRVREGTGVRVLDADGRVIEAAFESFDHFRPTP